MLAFELADKVVKVDSGDACCSETKGVVYNTSPSDPISPNRRKAANGYEVTGLKRVRWPAGWPEHTGLDDLSLGHLLQVTTIEVDDGQIDVDVLTLETCKRVNL